MSAICNLRLASNVRAPFHHHLKEESFVKSKVSYLVEEDLWYARKESKETPTDLAREWYSSKISGKGPISDMQYIIMVWAGIMINTRLHMVANGTMTGQRYIDEVLPPHVRLFRGAVGDKFVFMDDNATCHRTLAVQDCLDSEGIQCLVWPVRSHI
ncbi:transposable element Tc1 transposase [Trichonephila clavipes]|nr:transposable element Tc1 transposase [Trichonephila clavipes]